MHPMIAEITPDTALREMFGDAHVSVTALTGGGNSSIYRVDAGNMAFALKRYPSEVADPRRRQHTEKTALRFLAHAGINCVPTYRASAQNYSLFDWLEGYAVATADTADILHAAEITDGLQATSAHPAAQAIAPAFEACIALDDFAAQLERRCERLAAASDGDLLLSHFFDDMLADAIIHAVERARALYARYGFEETVIAPGARRLIHGDFGLHNMLRTAPGDLFVVDFEYFGWDDPAKMIADFALHPGTPLSTAQRALFLERTFTLLKDDALRRRLHALLPLYAIRWACIVCNMFLPERRRYDAANDWESRKEQQLLKATSLLTLCAREGLL